jgi:DNA-directed RNA polymerase subunit RPC12/RpoP
MPKLYYCPDCNSPYLETQLLTVYRRHSDGYSWIPELYEQEEIEQQLYVPNTVFSCATCGEEHYFTELLSKDDYVADGTDGIQHDAVPDPYTTYHVPLISYNGGSIPDMSDRDVLLEALKPNSGIGIVFTKPDSPYYGKTFTLVAKIPIVSRIRDVSTDTETVATEDCYIFMPHSGYRAYTLDHNPPIMTLPYLALLNLYKGEYFKLIRDTE